MYIGRVPLLLRCVLCYAIHGAFHRVRLWPREIVHAPVYLTLTVQDTLDDLDLVELGSIRPSRNT